MVRREPVLGPVAEAGFADSWKDLQDDVFAQLGSKNPQLVQISVYAGDEDEARRLADAVASALSRQARSALTTGDNAFVRRQIGSVRAEIAATTAALEEAQEALSDAPEASREELRGRVEALEATLHQQRSSFAELSDLDSSAVGSLSLIDEAWTSRSPLRPAPLVLGIAGGAAGFTIAAGWAHLFGRPRQRPAVRRPRAGAPPAPLPTSPRTAVPRQKVWAPPDA
jgi:uncharacterized protein involved in exopolysaccharide biosynthesis